GDFIGEPKHHGGDTQAAYLVAREELDHWGEQLGRDLRSGMFGENVTTTGLDVDTLPVGQRLGVGSAVVLRVCGPRTPCRTFAQHMGVKGWVKTFTARGHSGAYCAVEQPGEIRAGDEISLLDAPDHGIDVSLAFRAFMGDLDAAQRVLAARCLDPVEHQGLEAVVARRRR
ncbi:MAG: MOSC domain-containing protein, partial [Actinomycetota bacterium]|nr:MOSC domain-containing protein [Actinomycetota bacterium]